MTRPRTVVSVRGLGKRYDLGETFSSNTLRDAISTSARRLLRRPTHDRPSRDFWALKDMSFDVAEGEVLGVIGANGAGKSTLLKILSQITEPTTGEVRIRGRVASLLEVGTGFHQELSGRENVFMNGAILGMSQAEIRRRFDEIVEFAGIQAFIDTPVKRYSSGMLVRLGFAVAAHLEPEILMIDEVLAVGDAEFQQRCVRKMGDIASSGRTVLFVSHNLAAVESLCTRCVCLRTGLLVSAGAPGEVVRRYRSNALSTTPRGKFKPSLQATSWPRLLAALVSDPTGSEGVVRSDDDLIFKAVVDCGGGQSVRFEVAFLIYDRNGTLAFKCFSHTQHRVPFRARGEAHVSCVVADPRLAPGSYTVGIVLQANGHEVAREVDAMGFEILPVDLYKTGKLPQSPTGVFLPDAEWRLS